VTDTLSLPQSKTSVSTRLDVAGFVGTFVIGVSLYFGLRWVDAPQLVISVCLVGVMVGYAFMITRLPRLRLRLDQTGDNSYYLGLLFTLISMATALRDFGLTDLGASDETSARAIIANFGIALATTIAGIFLRVVLHQMRIDPAEIEATARLELSDAATRVRGTLDNVSIEMERLIGDIRQRAADNLRDMLEQTQRNLGDFVSQVTGATSRLTGATSEAHDEVITKMGAVTHRMTEVAMETEAIALRLRSIAPPPSDFATSLKRVSETLTEVSGSAELVGGTLAEAGRISAIASEEMRQAATRLTEAAKLAVEQQQMTAQGIDKAAGHLQRSLEALGVTLEEERQRMSLLETQVRRSTESANQANEAAALVLRNLVEVTRGLTDLMRSKA
jgi:hypothetical protein